MATQVKSYSFDEILALAEQKVRKAEAESKRNGGMCLNCKKNKAVLNDSVIDPFQCKECNAEIQKTIDSLTKMGGFTAVKVPRHRKQ